MRIVNIHSVNKAKWLKVSLNFKLRHFKQFCIYNLEQLNLAIAEKRFRATMDDNYMFTIVDASLWQLEDVY